MTLGGKRILITRRREQAEETSRVVRERGGIPVVIPLIRTGPPDSWEACDGALSRLDSFDAAAFTSVNAVEAFIARARSLGVPAAALARIPAAAVGETTAGALRVEGMRVAAIPAQFSAAALGAALGGALAGKKVLLPRGTLARDTLARALRESGASVEPVVVYATCRAADAECAAVARGVRAGEFDVVTLASPSAARYFGELFSAEERAHLGAHCRIAAIGETTAGAIRALGIPVDIVAAESTSRGLVDSMTAYFSRQ